MVTVLWESTLRFPIAAPALTAEQAAAWACFISAQPRAFVPNALLLLAMFPLCLAPDEALKLAGASALGAKVAGEAPVGL